MSECNMKAIEESVQNLFAIRSVSSKYKFVHTVVGAFGPTYNEVGHNLQQEKNKVSAEKIHSLSHIW
jgi:hypothetical protein